MKWDSRYWQRQHERGIVRESALKLELDVANATIRDLNQRLYGKHSEKGALPSEAQAWRPKTLGVLVGKRGEVKAMDELLGPP